MNRDFIKMLAILAMTLNHIGNILMEPGSMLQVIFVDIGYFTAITMCYFLVEGYRYTRDKARYGLRLFAFAVLSEIPYQLAFQGMLEGIGVNMMVTLFLCYLILIVREQRWSTTGKVILIFLLVYLTQGRDWGVIAPLFTLLFAWAYGDRKKTAEAYGAGIALFGLNELLWMTGAGVNTAKAFFYAVGACAGPFLSGLVILFFYNGKRAVRGRRFFTYFFYFYYPAHLVILYLLHRIL